MTSPGDLHRAYLQAFAASAGRAADRFPAALDALRRDALDRFGAMGLPSSRDEQWRHTRLPALLRRPLPLLATPATVSLPAASLRAPALAGPRSALLVFVNGRFAPELSELSALPAHATAGSLAAALAAGDERVIRHLGRHAEYGDEPFTALNTALFDDGAFLCVAPQGVLEAPVHVLFAARPDAEPAMTNPRLLLLAGGGARLAVLEAYLSCGSGPYVTNAVVEAVLEEGAALEHCRLEHEEAAAAHLSDLHATVAAGARFRSTCITLAGQLTRNGVRVLLAGEGASATLNGLFLTGGQQHVDNHTWIEHRAPGTVSQECYKGILAGRSTGVFCGRILVQPDAQRTDAYQASRALLLADTATVRLQPELEIHADDVKCAHGAAVGQLDADAVFYLRTRGLDEWQARLVLTQAFAAQVVQHKLALRPAV